MIDWRRFAKIWSDRVLSPFGVELIQSGPEHFPESTQKQRQLIQKYKPYTMTGAHRQWTLLRAIDYIEANEIPGDIVECGVWRGGNMMMIKEYRRDQGKKRRMFLYDTFAGMTEPDEIDLGTDGLSARRLYSKYRRDDHTDWAYASLPEVTDNFTRYGLLDDTVIFREGLVEQTLKEDPLPQQIALLRLDTDWYESTKCELEVLYPRLSTGGVLVIDDYGAWLGAQKATNEFFGNRLPILFPIDRACRMCIKR